MEVQEFAKWIRISFESLPRSKDPFFYKLWHDGKIRYKSNLVKQDLLGELCARLVCATIAEKQQTLLLMPDSNRSLVAELLATGLIMSSIDAIQTKQRGRRVLYFGVTTGIKSDLSNVSIGNLPMGEVFRQTYQRGGPDKPQRVIGTLPTVVCIYSPSDPASSVSKYSPLWVAIDCGDTSSVWWLPSLLPLLHEKGIPTIAWSSNPLTSIRHDFQSIDAHVFRIPDNRGAISSDIFRLFVESPSATKVVPLVISGDFADNLSGNLRKAYHALAAVMAEKPGRLGQDALAVSWRYLRSLERLAIPLGLFESESVQYWGVKPIGRLRSACEKFLSAIHLGSSVNTRNQLELAKTHLDIVYNTLQQNDPPLWNSLIDLCLVDVPAGHARVIIFPSTASKSMFSFALLARTKTSEKDLAKMRVWLMPLKDAASRLQSTSRDEKEEFGSSSAENMTSERLPEDVVWDVILVGLPNQKQSEKMAPFLWHGKCNFLLYQHQVPALSRLARAWGDALKSDTVALAQSLSGLTGLALPKDIPDSPPICDVDDAQTILGGELTKLAPQASKSIWEPKSEVDEVAFLFKDDDSDSSETDYEGIVFEEEPDSDNGQIVVVDKALEVKFTGGWSGLFAQNMLLNVVTNASAGSKVDRRYAKSLRPGDTIIYISGQRRQSLYELVLSRVHRHPSIEIHLALIRQWQTEIRQGYLDWTKQGHSLNKLFNEMIKRGTQLETDMALRFWVSGYTLRPRDREDMRRIAEILNLPFTREHYVRIHLAADRIHGLHISLSLRLSGWIKSGAAEATDDLIDEATGLTFSDVRDSLLLLHVESVTEISGPFYESTLGRIERSN
ncbi:hypothetical protein DEALK_06500 [Dehalogenimonas alkenigignens]|uniref:DISARM protein DrmE C-terminal domain-containing protein n=1 Tax=Dehalogenimonas alkenigignens TaxID=1217799 RepID=A0A0W0GGZ9_9CHLR|nr:hypothetical protein [Dehalogenimonas alkenigignens]KTB47805.1 hypothetical protein DEALK_06500 [Dehalogenimonas alkenigignens]